MTTIETRLQIELERRYLSCPGSLPEALQIDLADYPSLVGLQRWGVVRAADLLALLQPWTERPACDGERMTKVAGTRYALLTGLVDEPWVQVMVDDGFGTLQPWRGRRVTRPLMTIVGRGGELAQLVLPRSSGGVEAVLRRSTALSSATDWMTTSALGIDQRALGEWLAELATTHEPAFIALARRDFPRGQSLLADQRGRVAPETRLMIRCMRNLDEIARLVELMRDLAGPGRTTAEGLITALADADLTVAHIGSNDPMGHHLADGWMFMSTLRAYRETGGVGLAKTFPLNAYRHGGSIDSGIGVERAITHPETFAFYSDALQAAEIVAGTTRTLVRIDHAQPVDFFGGVELMRLAVVGLRSIARKSGHCSALNHANRGTLGRLALHLLRTIDGQAFDAYAEHWSNTRAVRAAGLTRRDLELGLTDPDLPHDIGSALVVKTEKVRHLVPVAADSVFDPWRWQHMPATVPWSGYAHVAQGQVTSQSDDGTLSRDLLASVAALGTDLPGYFTHDEKVIAEAVAICAMVGAHGTPLARDPSLFAMALRQAKNLPANGKSIADPKLRIVPRARRKIARLSRRAARTNPVHPAP